MPTKQTEKRSLWQRHIEAWKYSGKTQQAYCEEHNLKLHQLGYWNRRLTAKPAVEAAQISKPRKRGSAFVPVRLAQHTTHDQELTITLPSGVVIHGITTQTLPFLNQLVRALI